MRLSIINAIPVKLVDLGCAYREGHVNEEGIYWVLLATFFVDRVQGAVERFDGEEGVAEVVMAAVCFEEL
jgi:hypothetical protein